MNSNTNVNPRSVTGESLSIDGERYYKISNSHLMPEFFMSIVGASDHWMFISSRGALTAGRQDPDHALFPYAADDQISAARRNAGPYTRITIVDEPQNATDQVETAHRERTIWEPFGSDRFDNTTIQNLYKTPLGNKVLFEEKRQDLGLSFRYRWSYSEQFGFVRSCELENHRDHSITLELIDGLQNILPYGIGSEFTMRFSNLGNAYKKNEKLSGSNLGIFYLSSIPTDRAEPSEGLKASVAWQTGLCPDSILLCTSQLEARDINPDHAQPLTDENDIRGKSGAYLACQQIQLEGRSKQTWNVIADVQQDHSDIISLDAFIQENQDRTVDLLNDIQNGEHHLKRIIASVDGFQCGSNQRRLDRHVANTVFNAMRGGIPFDQYNLPSKDFANHIKRFNCGTFERHEALLNSLPKVISNDELQTLTSKTSDPDLIRLTSEYLPLVFSRRHGDPTRPWNRFSIQLKTESGEPNLAYQGNWRDLFQNWEALAMSFPQFTSAMINRFLNATTADGYNPYRVTKDGFEWEVPTPEDPWANIGYWGDHQIIYLLKLIESQQKTAPQKLNHSLTSEQYVHANVPYRIKNFEEIKRDPRDTIEFDKEVAKQIEDRIDVVGADGKLLTDQSGEIHRVTMLEKLLTLTLSKLSNFVPDGGIWLNTQRPEWNDANNALVGNGLSMVTTCYLYRWCTTIENWMESCQGTDFDISIEVLDFFESIFDVLNTAESIRACTDDSETVQSAEHVTQTAATRAQIVSALGQAGETYRNQLYQFGPSGGSGMLSADRCKQFFATAKHQLKKTIVNNRRPDSLFHAYNLLRWEGEKLHVDHLDEMLEGQVAVLSSGILNATETVDLLDSLQASRLYRENQNSYILYPDKQLPRFLSKNSVPLELVTSSKLLQDLLRDKNQSIIKDDLNGNHHFNGTIRNVNDLAKRLADLPQRYQTNVQGEKDAICSAFINLFGHHQFTGRSGTFFGYEGLGSIYWHMVSKLGLAVAENLLKAADDDAPEEIRDRIRSHYQAIRYGIGSEKTPQEYGAFPSDPYSHTPENAGVKQPGMTGQVKEDVLARFIENGITLSEGCIHFRFDLFDPSERLSKQQDFTWLDALGREKTVTLPKGSFAYTFCQTPIIYLASEKERIVIHHASGQREIIQDMGLDQSQSLQLFGRTGSIEKIECHFPMPS